MVRMVGMVRISSGVVVNTLNAHEEDGERAYDDREVGVIFI